MGYWENQPRDASGRWTSSSGNYQLGTSGYDFLAGAAILGVGVLTYKTGVAPLAKTANAAIRKGVNPTSFVGKANPRPGFIDLR